MRQPTPRDELYAWHTNAMMGRLAEAPAVYNEEPECGWFKTRLVRGGPFVPARIWLYQPTDADGQLTGPEVLQAELNGEYAAPQTVWERSSGNPISEHEFQYMTDLAAHLAEHAPDDPLANPRQRIDPFKIPTPKF